MEKIQNDKLENELRFFSSAVSIYFIRLPINNDVKRTKKLNLYLTCFDLIIYLSLMKTKSSFFN